MDNNVKYKKKEYWDCRYTSEEFYEWFKDYTSFRHFLQKYVKPGNKILMLGCGNSRLSADMYADGIHNIVNIDYSEVCIHNMQEKYKHFPDMEWKIMDIHNLQFSEDEFDVIIEKGTLDALLVDENDRWQLGEEAYMSMEKILLQCSKILKSGGKFISITFEQPLFRKRIYARTCLHWSVVHHAIGDAGCLEYFLYCMVKGEPLSKNDKDFECFVSKQRREKSNKSQQTICSMEENNIFKINCEIFS